MSRTGEIPDSYVDGFYRLVEGKEKWCPECGCAMYLDPDSGIIMCPKCGHVDERGIAF